MRIRAPNVNTRDIQGFTPDVDIFHRRPFGEALMQLVNNTDGPLVMALNADWGEGKSTFLKMWQAEARLHDLPVVIFDAFASDHTTDPFIAIASQLYELACSHEQADESALLEAFRQPGQLALQSLVRPVFSQGDSTLQQASDPAFNDDWMVERIKSLKQEQHSVQVLRQTLEALAANLSQSGRLVFVIDELDRCRPDYALSLLEHVRHFFSVPGLVFIHSVSRNQLEAAIKKRYGSDVDVAHYLEKFVHLWTTLPDGRLSRETRRSLYIRSKLEHMDYDASSSQSEAVLILLGELADYYELALKDIDSSLSGFALIVNALGQAVNDERAEMAAILSIVKVKHPMAFERLRAESIAYEGFVNATEMEDLQGGPFADTPEKHRARWLMKAFLMAEDQTAAFLLESKVSKGADQFHKDAVRDACRVINQFNQFV